MKHKMQKLGEKMNRRWFMRGVLTAAASVATGSVFAQPALQEVLSSTRRGNWNDQFDARGSTGGAKVVASNQPVISPATLNNISTAINNYNNIVAQGGWPVVPGREPLKIGQVHPAVQVLRQRLMISGDLPKGIGMSNSFDTYVDAAVKRFQARHGLPADGVMGEHTYAAMNVSADVRLQQLYTNLERLSGLADVNSNRFVMVNIPAAQIEAIENGRVEQRHTAVVGMIDRQTPLLTSKIHEVILNPFWTAPTSIIRKDIIPLMRKDPMYLTNNKIRLYNNQGVEVPPESVDWSTEEAVKLMFRQDPGKINAMASTKINFHNRHAVYMHDTPQKGVFNNLMRFDSSGCIRVQNIRDLDIWLLKNTPGWDRQTLENTIKSGENRPILINDPVDLYFVYLTAWSTGDGIPQFRNDIYKMDGVSELAMGTPI